MNLSSIKPVFPIFKNHPNLVYLDNAATTQTPHVVLDAMNTYYTMYRANVQRGMYTLSIQATEKYEEARNQIATFLNASSEEIIFTSGTTHGLNLLAYTLKFKPGDNIVLTRLEHHANLIPWQQAAKRDNIHLRFIELTPEGQLDFSCAKKLIDERTKIVSFAAISNSIGTRTPIKQMVELAKKHHALTIVDAAQLVAHEPVDVNDLDCDFLVFSGHKVYGPTGIGVLYGKKQRLKNMEPFLCGGGMIHDGSYEQFSWADAPHKFEAGTPPIAEAIALGEATKFLTTNTWEKIQTHEQKLVEYFFAHKPSFIKIVGPGYSPHRSSVISFTIPGIHPHDSAEILNRFHICVRAGHHCALPLMKYLTIPGTTRVSFGVYNTTKDIDALYEGLQHVKTIFAI